MAKASSFVAIETAEVVDEFGRAEKLKGRADLCP